MADASKLGPRTTRQRVAVVETLRQLDNFASAKTIHEQLQEQGYKVGLTTVYRTLQSLAEVHAVDVLNVAGGETLYRQCDNSDHHHHLVCTTCGKTVEIDGGPVERWAGEHARKHGFVLNGHTAEVFGTCKDCLDSIKG